MQTPGPLQGGWGISSSPADPPRSEIGSAELIAMLAMAMALSALGIDLMLPAFAAMRLDFGLAEGSTAVAGTVTAYFLGLAPGQLFYGPLADRFGRRPAFYAGFGLYALGALASAFAPSLAWLLVTRFVWGLGAAAPRVLTLTVIRDRYDGEQMSRVMSFVMAVFILVPVVAPTLGAVIVANASWRWVFGACVLAAALMTLWMPRLPETLREEHRLPGLRFDRLWKATRKVVSDRQTLGYSLAMAILFGAFMAYLSSSEIIFSETFGQREAFPLLFGGLAGFMGLAILVNARLVSRIGTRRLSRAVLFGYAVVATVLVVVALTTGGRPPLPLFLGALALVLASHGLLIPNLNTIAMEPMAEVAGTASSLIGAMQIAVGALLSIPINHAFHGTVTPLCLGFLGYGLAALGLVLWAEAGRRPATQGLEPASQTPRA